MNIGLHHLLKQARQLEKETIEENVGYKRFINRFIYFVGAFGIVVIIPQVTKVWISNDIKGISLITWSGFFITSLFWLSYGLVHREKAIIYTNMAASFLNFLIILGIILRKYS